MLFSAHDFFIARAQQRTHQPAGSTSFSLRAPPCRLANGRWGPSAGTGRAGAGRAHGREGARADTARLARAGHVRCPLRITEERQKRTNESIRQYDEEFGSLDLQKSYEPMFQLLWYSQMPCFDVKGLTSKAKDELSFLKRCKPV